MADRGRGSVRVRTTLGATAVVAASLVLGGVLLLHELQSTLTDGATRAAGLRATELVGLLDADVPPAALPLEAGLGVFIQVLDPAGSVVAASSDVAGRPALADPGAGRTKTARLDPGPIGDGEPFVAVTRGTADGGLRVTVGRSLEPVQDSTEVVTTELLAGIPLLTLLVAAIAWILTGRALRPVEAVRREVAAISAKELDRRVPVPAGNDEVARLATTMNAMLDRLEQSAQAQRRFVADASHELRSPLASMRSQLEVALAHPDQTTVVDVASEVLIEGLRLGRLLDDLLVLARADESVPQSRIRTVDLDDIVLAEAARLGPQARVHVDTSGVTAVRVHGDAEALTRLVRNLVENAVRHATQVVTLSLHVSDGHAQLEVLDDGAGIAPADRDRVFERFTRLDAARSRDSGGTGLGLAIVREVARSHGGSVYVGDGPGGQLIVRLPLGD